MTMNSDTGKALQNDPVLPVLEAVGEGRATSDQVDTAGAADLVHFLFSSPVWRKLVDEPYRADLFAVLRWIDSQRQSGPLLGRAARPSFDPVRLGQQPALTFAASTIAKVDAESSARPPQIHIYSFGLFGPNGPLPLHMTEYVRERLLRFNDPTLARFVDIFHHRLILLFYRAWADAQPHVSMDRPDIDFFTDYIASLSGYGQPAMQGRDVITDHAKLFHAPHLVRQTRNAEGLAKILSNYLDAQVLVKEFVPRWLNFERTEQTRLGSTQGRGLGQNNILGDNASLGERILDGQHTIRLRIGPMSHRRYCELLPNKKAIKQVVAWIWNYIGLELLVDMQLILHKEEVPQAQLGGMGQLGYSTWLGKYLKQEDADDFVIQLRLGEYQNLL